MVDIVRPAYGEAWASVGEKVSPTLAKIQGGWIQEMMPYQWENFLQNRQDTALLYMLQKGVPEWDASQEYIAGKSVVTYQTNLYISVLDSTNVLPTVQASWKKLNPSTSSSGLVTITGGGTGASTASDARTNLGLGTIATATAPTTNGFVVRTAADTLVSRSVTGTANNIVVINGDGVAGDISINAGSNIALLNTNSAWTSTGSIRLPSGSTSQQGSSTPGRVRFNLETDEFHGAYSDGWKVLARPASAEQTPITDVANLYTSSNVEGALQEVGLKASFVKDAILSYPDYAAASAAAATLPDGQEVVAPSESGVPARWQVQSGVLSFIENDLRYDIASLSPDSGANLVGGIIAKSRTINVPAQHSTIQDAMEYLRGFTVARGAIVTIKVADGEYTVTSPTSLNHPEGDRLRLIGNQSNPLACAIKVSADSNFDALVCSGAHVFGFIDGFYIERATKAGLANNTTGVLTEGGAAVFCGPNMRVNNFYYSFAARNRSYLYCDGVKSENAGDVGIWAFVGSTVYARNAQVSGASDAANGYGYGIQAEYGSVVDCSGATATGCLIAGIAAGSNSQVRAYTANSSGNTGSGILARDGGGIIAHNATTNGNGRYGLERISDGLISGNNITAEGNTLGNGFAKAFLSTEDGIARLAASMGPLRIDTSTPDQVYFNTVGGLQFAVEHTDAATSALSVRGGGAWSGDQPALTATGSATDIGIRYVTKGAGSHYFSAYGGVVQFDVASIANCVNRISARGSATGGAVSLRAVGSDAVIDLALLPKGSGSYVQIGSGWTASSAPAANGYILVKDSTGTVRKLLTTA